MAARRFNTLFVRLMLAQGVIMLIASLTLPLVITVARIRAACPPYAELWTPRLLQAASLGAAPDGSHSGGDSLMRQRQRPDSVTWASRNLVVSGYGGGCVPHFQRQGLPMDDMRLVLDQGRWMVWFHILPPSAQPVWIGADFPPLWFQPNLLSGFVLSMMFGLTITVSWLFARRVTRPLEDLGWRIDRDMRSLAQGRPLASPPPDGQMTSEIRAISQAYQELINRLQRIENERTLLLAGVSHDLRSPLGRIRLAAELLPKRSNPQADLDTIVRNVDHADRLVGSFLDFVRAGRLELKDSVDVAHVAQSVLQRFNHPDIEPELLRVNASTGTAGDPDFRLGQANALLLDRLIFNLLDNACKHGHPPVVLKLTRRPSTIEIDVRDDGAGLPSTGADDLREAFARGDASRHRPGSGLGLAIVQQITARLGGTLAFARESDGHHAVVSLPVTAPIRPPSDDRRQRGAPTSASRPSPN